MTRRKPKATGRRKQGQHRQPHPWEATEERHQRRNKFRNADIPQDRQRLGLGTLAVKTLADMTPEERAAIEREYGAKISPGR